MLWRFGVIPSSNETKGVFEYYCGVLLSGGIMSQKFFSDVCWVCVVLCVRWAEHHVCGYGKVSVNNDSRRRAEAGCQRRYILSVCGSHDGESTGTCKVFRGCTLNSPVLLLIVVFNIDSLATSTAIASHREIHTQ